MDDLDDLEEVEDNDDEEDEEDEEDEAALPTFDVEEEATFAEAYESAAEDAPLVLPDEETETL